MQVWIALIMQKWIEINMKAQKKPAQWRAAFISIPQIIVD